MNNFTSHSAISVCLLGPGAHLDGGDDPALRENFNKSVFAYHCWQKALAETKSAGGLVDFHTRHKFLLLAHSERHYRNLGRLLAGVKKHSLRSTYEEYGRTFLKALAIRTSAKKHANVLDHLMGYFSDRLSAAERRELVEFIRDVRVLRVPLAVPITWIRHYVKKYDIAYLADQVYLTPSPTKLMPGQLGPKLQKPWNEQE